MNFELVNCLIKCFGLKDDDRFFLTCEQIAASEARKGNNRVAESLKMAIKKAKDHRSKNMICVKNELTDLIEVIHSNITMADMILDEKVKTVLDRFLQEHRKSEILKAHNLMPARKLLLLGSPGCGKTMTVQALAGELGLAVFRIRLDSLVSKHLGESLANLKKIFIAMEDQKGIYLFDEFDSIGSMRDTSQEVGEIKRLLNTFLVNIENDKSESLIVAACNFPKLLDKALFRRFDGILQYPLPRLPQIKTLLRKINNWSEKDTLESAAEEAVGLCYSDIVHSCEETIKEMLMTNQKVISIPFLLTSFKDKKNIATYLK